LEKDFFWQSPPPRNPISLLFEKHSIQSNKDFLKNRIFLNNQALPVVNASIFEIVSKKRNNKKNEYIMQLPFIVWEIFYPYLLFFQKFLPFSNAILNLLATVNLCPVSHGIQVVSQG
jgi:hypothetical protein